MRYVTSNDNIVASNEERRTAWLSAYRRFLVSRHENMLLKIAPLALVGILPPEIISNLIPGIGLLDDFGYAILVIFVIYKTISRVNTYRY